MGRVQANGIEIEYETFGDSSNPSVLLIMGLGAQLIQWPAEMCTAIAGRGYFVIRYDNRDVGLSTRFDQLGPPKVQKVLAKIRAHEPWTPPYTLDDMADDAAGLLDALGIESAHICGASMGGMIAQCFALRHPRRARSLISLESTTGDLSLPPPTKAAGAMLMQRTPAERDAAIAHMVHVHEVHHGPNQFDAEWSRTVAARKFERGLSPEGTGRQYLAVLAAPDRTEALGSLDIPTLVLHGEDDPLIPVEHGRATAAAIPGAVLHTFAGWGHGLSPNVLGPLLAAILNHLAGAEAASAV